MERYIYKSLKSWKDSPNRKPLILQGARQVGKTYILKEFGKREYDNVVYINCDDNDDMKDMFVDYDIKRIIRSISAISGVSITPSSTLIILDEIQEINRGLSSLKYFCAFLISVHRNLCPVLRVIGHVVLRIFSRSVGLRVGVDAEYRVVAGLQYRH